MLNVQTQSGFTAEIDERTLEDWRFLRALVKSEKGTDLEKLEAANVVAEMLLGSDNVEKLCESIAKDNGGYVPSKIFMEAIAEIITSCKQTKN